MKILTYCLLAIVFLSPTVRGAEQKKNVLFIVADDLRVELGCYGSTAHSPNIDALAKQGLLFQHAYCQQAVCNPSRSSFLTGKRPDTLRHWVNGTHFRVKNPNVVTMPEWFKKQGYTTRNVGKIFHNWHTEVKGDRQSWSADEFLHYANHGKDVPAPKLLLDQQNQATSRHCFRYDVPDDAYYDGQVANEALKVLSEIKNQPFFLAVGFWKPHAPFNAPAKYWKNNPVGGIPRLNPARPKNSVEWAFHDSRELMSIPPKQFTFTQDDVRAMRQGYFANIEYMDAQLGRVIRELDRLKLRDSTIIVFVSDHGYQLGEHGLWAKTSCFELDARVPLLIVDPSGQGKGKQTQALAELIDLFPTLVEMCGLPARNDLDGKSLVHLLQQPEKPHRSGALTQHPRPAYYDRTEKGIPDAMGYSIRTADVRYTEWRDWETGKILGRELYEHRTDPGELNNTVDNPGAPEHLATAIKELHLLVPTSVPPAKR
ncbi:MAG: sulfatase [Zavarzinella sp.]